MAARSPSRPRPRLPGTGTAGGIWPRTVGVLLLLGVLASACTQPSAEPLDLPATVAAVPADSGGGTLQHSLVEPTAITPASARTAEDLLVVDQVFDSLTR